MCSFHNFRSRNLIGIWLKDINNTNPQNQKWLEQRGNQSAFWAEVVECSALLKLPLKIHIGLDLDSLDKPCASQTLEETRELNNCL